MHKSGPIKFSNKKIFFTNTKQDRNCNLVYKIVCEFKTLFISLCWLLQGQGYMGRLRSLD